MDPNPQLCKECGERPISDDILLQNSGMCCICKPFISRAERKKLLVAEFEDNEEKILHLRTIRRKSQNLLELCTSHTEIKKLAERNEDISEYLRCMEERS
jgi:hypothetical protein